MVMVSLSLSCCKDVSPWTRISVDLSCRVIPQLPVAVSVWFALPCTELSVRLLVLSCGLGMMAM